jgi:hypothetical protein
MIPSQESYEGWRRRSRQTWRQLSPIHSLGSLKSRDIEELIMVRQCDVCSANYFARRRNSRYCPDRCRKERNGAVSRSPVYQVPQHVDAGGPRIQVYGTMEYGRLRIRHKGR